MRRRNCPSEHRLLSGASSCASPIEAVPTADRTLRSTAVEKGPTLTLHWIRLASIHGFHCIVWFSIRVCDRVRTSSLPWEGVSGVRVRLVDLR